jgi:hypothetical protein
LRKKAVYCCFTTRFTARFTTADAVPGACHQVRADYCIYYAIYNK